MISISVHVEHDDGSNASGKNVYLSIHSWPAKTWLDGYTDDNGDVDFDMDENDGVEVTFMVDGDEYQTDSVSDGDAIFITI
jgi:hypothetical protein